MANHGVVAVGRTLDEAYMNSVYAEDTAKIYHMALASGQKPVVYRGMSQNETEPVLPGGRRKTEKQRY